jgi:hypothetical protein
MGNPKDDRLSASIGALYAESRTWADIAERLDQMSQVARGLTLSAFEFSAFAHNIGLDGLYNTLQELIASRLQQGSTNCDNIAEALRRSAAGYQADEERASYRIKKIG